MGLQSKWPRSLPQVAELETLPGDMARSAYTHRILEIVGSIRKQKEEITKVTLPGAPVFHPVGLAGPWLPIIHLSFFLSGAHRFFLIPSSFRKRSMLCLASWTGPLL